nr:hypothetical protein [Tanacetum cinerariifolium]
MRTRSQSRSRNNSPQREASPSIVEPLRIELPFLEDQFQEDTPPESPMADNRTMAELLQAPTEGYEDAIVIQICLWCIDSGCSKHMTGNLKLLVNFVWKFMGTVRFGNDHVAAIMGFGKSKRASYPPKPVLNSRQRLHLLYMDLCGPMRIASINGKRYVLVIVDDYSHYTWVHFLRSKDEAPEVIIKFLKRITVLLQSPVIIIRNDNGTEFKIQVLKEYFDTVGISHQMSSVRTPQQNRVVERQNRTKPDISFLHVFGALCYPKNGREDIGKLGAKGDIGFFIGYSADSCAYIIYNRRTKKIMETMNVSFDELSAMAFEQRSSKPGLQRTTPGRRVKRELEMALAERKKCSNELEEENIQLRTAIKGWDASLESIKSEKTNIISKKKSIEAKYVDEIILLTNSNKVAAGLLQKFQMPTQTIPILSKTSKIAYQDLHKTGLGFANPWYGKNSRLSQPSLYCGEEILKPVHPKPLVHDS